MAATLIALAGPLQPQVVPVPDAGLTLGRDPTNDLHPPDLSLSRRHCTFTMTDGHVTLADLDSMNGTFVNGLPIRSRVLEHGDQIKIGESVFLFVQKDAAPAAPSGGADEAIAGPTIQIRREDVLHLQSDAMVDAFSAASHRAQHLETLLRVSRALGDARSPEDVRRALFDLLFAMMPADCAALVSSEAWTADPSAVQTRSRPGAGPVQISQTIVRRVLSEGVAILSADASHDAALRDARSVVASGTRSVLCVPMMRGGRAEGAVYVATIDSAAPLDKQHLELLTAVAGLAALAFRNVEELQRLEAEANALRGEVAGESSLLGESAPIRAARELIAKAARSDATVLIVGESGTGKELAARDIHRLSTRARQPFVTINASELAESLLESELFGHEKGAFTGAIAQKKGKLELADGGTLFLDEIGDLSPAVQVKLLRVLQERELTRVGGTRPITIDVRVVAATNRDLDAAVKAGAFRQDLFYRLNVIMIRMPPLRERPDDVPLLAALFGQRAARACKRHIVGLSAEARAALVRYDWPGNVRELENAIERAVVLGGGDRIGVDDLPETIVESPAGSEAPTKYHDALVAAKRRVVAEALERASGDVGEAARELGMHPNNLHRLIRNLGLRKKA